MSFTLISIANIKEAVAKPQFIRNGLACLEQLS